MSLADKLNGAQEQAKLFGQLRGFTKNQFRSIYAHLKSLERTPDDAHLQVELKLFLARLYYKTKRGGQGRLPNEVLEFFKGELGNVSCDQFKRNS